MTVIQHDLRKTIDSLTDEQVLSLWQELSAEKGLLVRTFAARKIQDLLDERFRSWSPAKQHEVDKVCKQKFYSPPRQY